MMIHPFRTETLAALVAALSILLIGCASTPKPETPEQALYLAWSEFNLVLKAANAYAESPSADPQVVEKLADAAERGRAALERVRPFLTAPPSEERTQALEVAQHALREAIRQLESDLEEAQ